MYRYEPAGSNLATKNLKSNMDRFIGLQVVSPANKFIYLKSNMDRFIALITTTHSGFNPYLKSNMDRFIALVALPRGAIFLI